MGKRKDRSQPSPDQKDALKRMNYLYQAAVALSMKQESLSKNVNLGVCRSLVQRMKIIGQKTQIRLVPELKADVCKICHTPLHIQTCKVEIQESPRKKIQKTCKTCGFAKKLKV
jgi:RNase P subunit RPR2